MDADGASLAEIANLLGHADTYVTAGYLGRKTQPTRAASRHGPAEAIQPRIACGLTFWAVVLSRAFNVTHTSKDQTPGQFAQNDRSALTDPRQARPAGTTRSCLDIAVGGTGQHSPMTFVAELGRPATKSLRKLHLGELDSWLVARGINVFNATTSDINEFIEFRAANLAPASRQILINTIRSYYRWLEDRGAIDRNPVARIRGGREHRPIGRYVPPDDLRALLSAADTPQAWIVIAALAFHSLKISELLACDVHDLLKDESGRSLRFVTHIAGTRRVSQISLIDELAAKLDEHVDGRQSGPLILGKTGARLTRNAALGRLSTVARRAGITYKLTPQMLTNTLTAVAMERGFSYRSLARAKRAPDRRHADRWLPLASASLEDNASVRLGHLVLGDPSSPRGLLLHAENVLEATDLPPAASVMLAGAVLERQLREACVSNGLTVPSERKQARISAYVHLLRAAGLLDIADQRSIEVVAEARNNAAHGDFEGIGRPDAREVLRSTARLSESLRSLVEPSTTTDGS